MNEVLSASDGNLDRTRGFYGLVMSEDAETLGFIYELMEQIDGLKVLKKFWNESIKVSRE